MGNFGLEQSTAGQSDGRIQADLVDKADDPVVFTVVHEVNDAFLYHYYRVLWSFI